MILLPLKKQEKSRSGACIFFYNSLIYYKLGKRNHVSRSTTEAEFYVWLEGITEVESVQDVFHFANEVDKRIFNCKNIIQIQERLPAQSNPSYEQRTLKLLISRFNKKLQRTDADIFTKSLAQPLFEYLRKDLVKGNVTYHFLFLLG